MICKYYATLRDLRISHFGIHRELGTKTLQILRDDSIAKLLSKNVSAKSMFPTGFLLGHLPPSICTP